MTFDSIFCFSLGFYYKGGEDEDLIFVKLKIMWELFLKLSKVAFGMTANGEN